MTQRKSCCEPAPKPKRCCGPAPEAKGQGFLMGLFYGLVPHTFCILFIVLSVVGATAATSMLKRFLYIPYIFQIIVVLSFVFATVSAAFYLRRNGSLSLEGARARWKYLTVMYATTVGINLLFFTVVFPMVANLDLSPAPVVSAQGVQAPAADSAVMLTVQLPCPGHAPLIKDELKKVAGIGAIQYSYPNSFRVSYDPSKVTVQQILALPVSQQFPAAVQG